MKLWHLLVVGAALGAWYLWRRSSGPGGIPFFGGGNPITYGGQGAPTPYTPTPIAPHTPGTSGGGWMDTAAGYGNQAIGKFGDVSEETFRNLCGSGKSCEVGAKVANYAGKATVSIPIKSIEYTAKGARAVWNKLF